MLEVGKNYKTKTGKNVRITSINDQAYSNPCEALEAMVDMGDGIEHWTMYSRDGKCYESASFDIETNDHFTKTIEEFTSRHGVTISVLDAFKEGLEKGYSLAQNNAKNIYSPF